jgi:hypothetical protein
VGEDVDTDRTLCPVNTHGDPAGTLVTQGLYMHTVGSRHWQGRECDGGTEHWPFGYQDCERLRGCDLNPYPFESVRSADLERDPERCAEHAGHARRIVERY